MGEKICCCASFIVVLLLLGIETAKICMGAKHDCNTEKMISAWLIVSGSAPILFGIVFFIPWRLRKNPYGVEESCQLSDIWSTIVGTIGFIFIFAWLIYGGNLVFPKFHKVLNKEFNQCTGNVTTGCTKDDCNEYITFAFAMATTDLILMVCWIAVIGYIVYKAC